MAYNKLCIREDFSIAIPSILSNFSSLYISENYFHNNELKFEDVFL